MKILQCHNFYRFPGGEDQVFHDESWLLKNHGHDVYHYLRDNRDIDTMPRVDLVKATIWNRQTINELQALIEQVTPDLIHFHNTFPLISTSAYHTAKSFDIPIVQTLHNYRYMCPSATLFRNGKECHACIDKKVAIPAIIHKCYRSDRKATALTATATAIQRSIKKSFQLVDRFIALSEHSRRHFERAGLPPSKILVKPNFVRPDPGIKESSHPHAVFVGRLTQEKGINTLLEAWQPTLNNPLQDIPIRIIGQGPLEQQVRHSAEHNQNISYLGQMKHDEVLKEVAKARLLVFPSIWPEPFGRSMIEAFATGTPVVASNTGSIPEIVENEYNGLHFAPGNALDLQRKVARLFHDQTLLAQTGLAARMTFERRYTPQQNIDVLHQAYAEAIDSNSPKMDTHFA
jgi:glycosyltransferase involved in cell wall biosynthesis